MGKLLFPTQAAADVFAAGLAAAGCPMPEVEVWHIDAAPQPLAGEGSSRDAIDLDKERELQRNRDAIRRMWP